MGFFNKSTKSSQEFTRLFYSTDVHGSNDCFAKFLNAGKEYNCKAIVLGGDISGKMVVPIIEQLDGTYHANFIGNPYQLKNMQEVAQLEEHIARSGSYGYMTDVETIQRLQALGEREQKIEAIAQDLMVDRLREWVKLADERLGDSDVKIYMGAGNDDPFLLDEVLHSSNVIVVYDGDVVRVDEHHEMMGTGYANMTPWTCPRDIEEDELARKIDALVGRIEDVPNSIFCVHIPPVDSLLDTCYKLDASVYPPSMVLDKRGQPIQFGGGSTAVRSAIEKYQPLAGLHGHIHESRGRVKIGRTECFIPGSEYAEGVLRGVIINLTEDSVRSYQFTSG